MVAAFDHFLGCCGRCSSFFLGPEGDGFPKARAPVEDTPKILQSLTWGFLQEEFGNSPNIRRRLHTDQHGACLGRARRSRRKGSEV